jgi:hypothetical protein
MGETDDNKRKVRMHAADVVRAVLGPFFRPRKRQRRRSTGVVMLKVPDFMVYDSPEMPFPWADGPEREEILDHVFKTGGIASFDEANASIGSTGEPRLSLLPFNQTLKKGGFRYVRLY